MDASQFRALIGGQPWSNAMKVPPAEWTCGYCGRYVASDQGYNVHPRQGGYLHIRICSNCGGPTFFLPGDTEYAPAPMPGREVEKLPPELASLFHEARASAGAGAATAAVMTCRKILMHIAVEEGAKTNLGFVDYVDYLQKNHYAPPKSEKWVDSIRKLGNEANHEIKLMSSQDAQLAIKFVQMLLEFLYEAPGIMSEPSAPTS